MESLKNLADAWKAGYAVGQRHAREVEELGPPSDHTEVVMTSSDALRRFWKVHRAGRDSTHRAGTHGVGPIEIGFINVDAEGISWCEECFGG